MNRFRLSFLSVLLVLVLGPAFAAGFSGDSFGNRGFFQYSSSSAAPNTFITPIFSNFQIASGTTTMFGAFEGNGNTLSNATSSLSTTRQVPIPIAGTLSNLQANLSTGTTGATIQSVINGTAATLTCVFAPSCSDSTHSDAIAAGDRVQWTFNSHGGTWAMTNPSQIASLFTSTNGSGVILTGPSSNGIGPSSTQYLNIGGAGQTSATEIAESGLFSIPGQITGMFITPNVADTGANVHTYTLMKNGVATSMACTGVASLLGCCANLTGSSGGQTTGGASCATVSAVSISVGDTLSIQLACGGTCATVAPGAGLVWVPSTAGLSPLFALGANIGTAVFDALSDSWANPPSAQTNYQITPALTTPSTMTFSSYIACVGNNPTGATTRTASLQIGTNLATLPSTPGGGPVATFGLGQACPGANSGVFAGGIQDTTHTLSAAAAQTMDTAMTVSGSPATSGVLKVGMAVHVP